MLEERKERVLEEYMLRVWRDVGNRLGLGDHRFKEEILDALIFAYDWGEDGAKRVLKDCTEEELAVLMKDYQYVRSNLFT